MFVYSRACEVLPNSSLASFHMEHFLNEELRDLRDQMQLDDGNSCTMPRLINAFWPFQKVEALQTKQAWLNCRGNGRARGGGEAR